MKKSLPVMGRLGPFQLWDIKENDSLPFSFSFIQSQK
jgi:hypothetical protein